MMGNNNFDEAQLATQEMFEQEAPIDESLDETVQDVQSEVTAEQDEQFAQTADEAVQMAEMGAQAVQQKDSELQQVLQELGTLREQNQAMQGTIEQMSQQREESIVNEMTQPQLPILDIDSMAFDDDETRQTKQQEYTNAVTDYIKTQMMSELSPFIEQAKAGQFQKERADMIESLKDVPELRGIEQMLPQLDKIVANDKMLSSESIPLEEKYIKAYVMAKGIDMINSPQVEHTEPGVEDLMNYYNTNNDFRDMVERTRVEQLQKGQQVPPMSASNGAVNAALNIKEKPTTFDEASERTKKMFGFN